MSSTSCFLVEDLDCCTDDVIVMLKEYNEINNQTMFSDNDLLYDGDVEHAVDILQRSADNNVAEDPDKQKQSMLDECEWDMQQIKNSYNTYIPEITSQKIDCDHCVMQNCPSHSHITTLIEHILDDNDALMLWMWMKSLKMECLLDETEKKINQHMKNHQIILTVN